MLGTEERTHVVAGADQHIDGVDEVRVHRGRMDDETDALFAQHRPFFVEETLETGFDVRHERTMAQPLRAIKVMA